MASDYRFFNKNQKIRQFTMKKSRFNRFRAFNLFQKIQLWKCVKFPFRYFEKIALSFRFFLKKYFWFEITHQFDFCGFSRTRAFDLKISAQHSVLKNLKFLRKKIINIMNLCILFYFSPFRQLNMVSPTNHLPWPMTPSAVSWQSAPIRA
jgi:hypothetical protein